MVTTQQGFPQLSAPIADIDNIGRVTQPWLQFFISLWNRTGAQQGSSTGFTPGDLKPIAGPDITAGWLLCDGSAISRIDFPGLYAAIGTTWGPGNGSTTFNIPDLQGKMLLGADTTHLLGQTGGAATTSISVANLPAHNHGIVDPGHTHTVTDPGHTHTVTDPGHIHTITDPGHVHSSRVNANTNTAGAAAGATTTGNTASATTGISIDSHTTGVTNASNTTGVTNASNTTGITTQNTGSGGAFTTISPYGVVQWIIKT